ncbi:uncharacterized protein LOC144144763 [Haemaphysalis longicornis]
MATSGGKPHRPSRLTGCCFDSVEARNTLLSSPRYTTRSSAGSLATTRWAEGAPFSAVLRDDVTVHRLLNPHPHLSALTQKDAGPLPSGLRNKDNKIANRDDSDYKQVIPKRNYELNSEISSFANINDLRSEARDADLTNAKARKSISGSVGEDAAGDARVLSKNDSFDVFQRSSGSFAESDNVNLKSAISSLLPRSQTEEDCEEEEENDGEHTVATSPTPSDDIGSTDPDEDCDTEEPTEGYTLKPEPTDSPSESDSNQTEDEVYRPSTRTTQRPRKPRDPNRSSGSFHDISVSEGVDFSDSVSKESYGRSTEFTF